MKGVKMKALRNKSIQGKWNFKKRYIFFNNKIF